MDIKNPVVEVFLKHAHMISEQMMPYATADLIIKEVAANGTQARERVMQMLMLFGAEAVKNQAEMMKMVAEDLQNLKALK
jgi:hypothetical protein